MLIKHFNSPYFDDVTIFTVTKILFNVNFTEANMHLCNYNTTFLVVEGGQVMLPCCNSALSNCGAQGDEYSSPRTQVSSLVHSTMYADLTSSVM